MTATMTAKKITLATLKSFVKKNAGKILVMHESYFDGMIDGTSYVKNPEFIPAQATDRDPRYTLGIAGVYVIPYGSRNSFSAFESEKYTGIHVYNACGSFTLAIEKAKYFKVVVDGATMVHGPGHLTETKAAEWVETYASINPAAAINTENGYR